MEWYWALSLLVGLVVFLMVIGLPVAFVFLGVNVVGAYLFLGGTMGLGQVVRNGVQSLQNYSLAPIPMFILMGELMLHSGMAGAAIHAVERLIRKVPGRMPIVSVVAGTLFAALSGSSMANTAMLGSSLLPQMLKSGYAPRLAIGPMVAVGGIAILIPPSALAVLLGSLAKISIAALLVAGIVPALIMAVLFVGYILIRALAGDDVKEDVAPDGGGFFQRAWPFLRDVLPLFLIFVAVVGSLLAGIATPTESAAIGVAATVIAGLAYRRLSIGVIGKTMMETAKISAMILFIIVGSITFSQILAFSGAASGLLSVITAFELTPLEVILLVLVVLLLLGCFIDQVSMMMITLPFFLPLANSVGVDLIWLGLVYLLSLEIALITPPFGLLLFVMKGVAPKEISFGTITMATLPFLGIQMAVLVLIVIWPEIALWLPKLLLAN
ncbi:TRAP transporter large permease [Maritimibacter dapengensis]|uniref:TRAP transporter large permease protein n=1 Tax=Maritimibacter dapengensis TaxID=2836868 RepID=A0ABS6T445_9RHOB|nr:TRAP transporter large permease [Maritimibacter dapengensis]MBV7380023.1 TRAP transporter large permease [Maritimibacter dapengensis]